MNRGRPVSLLFLSALLAGGCALDGVDDGGGNGDFPERIPSDDPAVDDRLDGLEIVCESTYTVTGTFVEGAPQPADENGCWAVGTWTVQTTLDFQGCDPQPELLPSYTYEVTRPEDSNSNNVLYVDDPDEERVNLKISTAGDGLCHGAFDHFALDNSVVALRPTLQEDGTLTGTATYSFYSFDPF